VWQNILIVNGVIVIMIIIFAPLQSNEKYNLLYILTFYGSPEGFGVCTCAHMGAFLLMYSTGRKSKRFNQWPTNGNHGNPCALAQEASNHLTGHMTSLNRAERRGPIYKYYVH
jgi:hypothetical protein